jgi:arsenate reductase
MTGLLNAQKLSAGARNGVAFLCVANSGRSQMAEGFARFLGPAEINFFSAGSAPSNLNPIAVRAMKEVGVNISAHQSKEISSLPLQRISVVITLCAEEECPILPGHIEHIARPMLDPASVQGSDESRLNAFRNAREEIRELVSSLF